MYFSISTRSSPNEHRRIDVGMDRDRADTHRPRGADDATGDLAAVGDEEALDHRITSETGRTARGWG